MLYLFLDESSGIGSQSRDEDEYFVVVIVATRVPRRLEKCLTRVKKAKLPRKLRLLAEIKASNAPDSFRRSLYRELAEEDFDIYVAVLNAADIPSELRGREGHWYRQVIGQLLTHCPLDDEPAVHMFLDRRKLKGLTREEFDRTLLAQLTQRFGSGVRFIIQHVDSTTSKAIQVADYVCWAVFRRYQRGDSSWYRPLRSKVKLTLRLFKGRKSRKKKRTL